MNIFETLIIQPLFNLLMAIYAVIPGGDFGISIIVFTILLRFVLHPLVKKQLHQTKVMRKMQPKLEEIKRQTKGNRQMQSLLTMELYKEHGVNPLRSIGIILVQLPVFISLYVIINIFTLHRDQLGRWTYNFLENFAPIKQIVDNPDTFNQKLLGIVDLTQHAVSANGINIILMLIAIIAAVGQFYQSKQTMPQADAKRKLRDILKEAASGKEADNSEINAIMMQRLVYFLPFLTLIFMLSFPGGIALYYAVSTLTAVAQQTYILRQDQDEMLELASKGTSVSKAVPSVKKSEMKDRASKAKEANITRIVAKSSRPTKPKKNRGGKR